MTIELIAWGLPFLIRCALLGLGYALAVAAGAFTLFCCAAVTFEAAAWIFSKVRRWL